MDYLQQSFTITFQYKVFFTTGLFDVSNTLLRDYLVQRGGNKKILFVIDAGVLQAHPHLKKDIQTYFDVHQGAQLVRDMLVIAGGEIVKNEESYFRQVVAAVNTHGIDRHSYIAAIGGGSVLDLVGYAAAVSHRGIRHLRIPTTVLSQNDSGVGVKNGINYFGKKNFLGTFAPPQAVFNDNRFLPTLPDRAWRSGIAEAIKVALIKDKLFFDWLETNAGALANRDAAAMQYLIERCAQLHMEHIGGADPFETGSSRPLDFGHWSAHKLEQLTDFDILHGEAVAMGMALDTMYSHVAGLLPFDVSERIIHLLLRLGFDIVHPLMEVTSANSPIIQGLEEFREHLGGQLTIMLLQDVGKGIEVHDIDKALLQQASQKLQLCRLPAIAG
jgi:3-dehydroquinate synthase